MNRGLFGISNEDIDFGAGLAGGNEPSGLPGVQSGNCFIGYQAGLGVQTTNFTGYVLGTGPAGMWNTFIGFQAGLGNLTGDSNVALGYQANVTNTNASVSIGFGASATSGYGQIVIGATASITGSGSNEIVIGYGASSSPGSAGATVVIGGSASVSSPSGVAIGYSATVSGSSSTPSIAIGRNTTSGGNAQVAIGYGANAGSGTGAVTIGYETGNGSLTAAVTLIGYNAGHSNTSGVNIFIGYESGYSPAALGTTYATTTGTGQTCIGYGTGQAVVSATAPNYITCLGYQTTVGASGGVAIGTDHTGTAATTSTQDAIQLGTTNHTTYMAGTNTASGATASAPTLGAAAQLAQTVKDAMVYLDVTTAGQITIAMGPTSGVANTIFSDAVSGVGYTFRVPAGWYVAVTTSSTAVWSATAITC